MSDIFDKNLKVAEEATKPFKPQIVWRNVAIMGALHLSSVYALTSLHKAHFSTIIWEFVMFVVAGLGITAGAHRLWAHRSYKARLPLRILLAVFNSAAVENSILEWARDHRGHHKFSESDADPHNSKRGFFFAHVGWLLMRKHPDVIKKGKRLDLGDLYADPVVRLQDRFYPIIAILLGVIFPTVVPVMLWNESLWISYMLCLLRICLVYNGTWLVNSAAHLFGYKPYDKDINPSENWMVAFLALGEGFHNYHHVFPHDYSTSEFGLRINPTTAFIDFMCFIGLAYDCRKVSAETVLARRKRTGDLKEH